MSRDFIGCNFLYSSLYHRRSLTREKKEDTLLREINIILVGGNESFVAEPRAPASSPSLEISLPLWEI